MLARRGFLKGVGASPVLQVVGSAAADATHPDFTPVDLTRYFNASAVDFGPREPIRFRAADGLVRTPGGSRQFRGIPFQLGPGEVDRKSWIALSSHASSWTAASVEIPLARRARFLCLAQFCDWDENELRPSGVEAIERAGQLLADAVLVYEGGERKLPIRRRFEVGAPSFPWGHWNFHSVTHAQLVPTRLSEGTGQQWGENQTSIRNPEGPPLMWICALENPEPERTVQALRLRADGTDTLLVAGYVVLALPYMYRAVDTGLQAIDVRSLTEAAQSLGAGWGTILLQIIFPNLRVALISGAFLTLATVMGEFTIASFLVGINAFGPYMSQVGQNKAYESASLAIISFLLTWASMGLIQLLSRGRPGQGSVVAAH